MKISSVFSEPKRFQYPDEPNPRLAMGNNRPPDALEMAQGTMADVATFLAETPVVDSHETAKRAGLYVERITKLFGDMEDERDEQVRPLNEQVAEINAKYKVVHNSDPKKPGSFDKVMAELRYRLTAYAKAEERKREEAAEAARVAAAEADHIAREAEAKEQEAKSSADVGELGVDVATSIVEADRAFADFQRADRAAAVAEREVHVRISSSLGGRALSMRTVETLAITDHMAALTAIGLTEKIGAAILSAARDYKRLHGQLPSGISSSTERKI